MNLFLGSESPVFYSHLFHGVPSGPVHSDMLFSVEMLVEMLLSGPGPVHSDMLFSVEMLLSGPATLTAGSILCSSLPAAPEPHLLPVVAELLRRNFL